MRSFVHLLLLMSLAAVTVGSYEYFAPGHFYTWFFQQGSYISLSVTFVSTFWREVDKETRLVSASPVQYVEGCRAVLAGVILVLGETIKPPKMAGGKVAETLEGLGTLITCLVLLLYLAFWAFAIAPLLYFVILLTGAPARSGMAHKASAVTPGEKNGEAETSFWAKPVGSTYAVTALLIWGIKTILGL
ncbi:hypothetical protein LNV09_24460 [Paucibacter sp. B2R-40]|uniref:hypothetical protein n=1 Tax=Paucibacter sp. B2R-40 TaxID=2893554 RepID=UPI0021E3D47F|nr:hypothetical protein [Paucibacter sp. B2R-40]MCV2357310.1 hypothetical protein [Paucibacter sp. B2R-40]